MVGVPRHRVKECLVSSEEVTQVEPIPYLILLLCVPGSSVALPVKSPKTILADTQSSVGFDAVEVIDRKSPILPGRHDVSFETIAPTHLSNCGAFVDVESTCTLGVVPEHIVALSGVLDVKNDLVPFVSEQSPPSRFYINDRDLDALT